MEESYQNEVDEENEAGGFGIEVRVFYYPGVGALAVRVRRRAWFGFE